MTNFILCLWILCKIAINNELMCAFARTHAHTHTPTHTRALSARTYKCPQKRRQKKEPNNDFFLKTEYSAIAKYLTDFWLKSRIYTSFHGRLKSSLHDGHCLAAFLSTVTSYVVHLVHAWRKSGAADVWWSWRCFRLGKALWYNLIGSRVVCMAERAITAFPKVSTSTVLVSFFPWDLKKKYIVYI